VWCGSWKLDGEDGRDDATTLQHHGEAHAWFTWAQLAPWCCHQETHPFAFVNSPSFFLQAFFWTSALWSSPICSLYFLRFCYI